MERIREVRKTLSMTQGKFAERIGIASNTITQYENGNRIPSNQVILAICREFDVNEEWLRNGTGEMFNKKDSFSLDDYAIRNGLTDFEKNLFRAYFQIKPEIRTAFIKDFMEKYQKTVERDEKSPSLKENTDRLYEVVKDGTELQSPSNSHKRTS